MNPALGASSHHYAWFVVALLVPVALLNYLDRQMLATMKSSMVGDIPSIANKADWGLVLGCFKWSYALLSPLGGYVADRLSRRHVIGASLFVWSLVTWWTGHVTTFHELLTARALMRISEACYVPAALALIADYHSGSTRSRAVGLHQTGIYLGQGKAGVSAILFVQLASLAGALLGGTLADRWMRFTPRGRIFTSAIGMTLFLPALFSVGNAGTLPMAVAGLVVFGLGWGIFDCNNMPIRCQIARPGWRATGYGIMNLVSISCGGFGDWIFGGLRDRHVPLNVIFGAFAGVALLSVFLVLLIEPRDEIKAPAA